MVVLTYEEKKRRLMDFLRAHRGGNIRLGKNTSNLFRDRKEIPAQRLEVRDFNQVLRVDVAQLVLGSEQTVSLPVALCLCPTAQYIRVQRRRF